MEVRRFFFACPYLRVHLAFSALNQWGGCSIHPQGELLPTVKIRTLTKEEAPQGRNQEELQAQRCAV